MTQRLLEEALGSLFQPWKFDKTAIDEKFGVAKLVLVIDRQRAHLRDFKQKVPSLLPPVQLCRTDELCLPDVDRSVDAVYRRGVLSPPDSCGTFQQVGHHSVLLHNAMPYRIEIG